MNENPTRKVDIINKSVTLMVTDERFAFSQSNKETIVSGVFRTRNITLSEIEVTAYFKSLVVRFKMSIALTWRWIVFAEFRIILIEIIDEKIIIVNGMTLASIKCIKFNTPPNGNVDMSHRNAVLNIDTLTRNIGISMYKRLKKRIIPIITEYWNSFFLMNLALFFMLRTLSIENAINIQAVIEEEDNVM